MNWIKQTVQQNQDYVIALRRHFRMNPETGGEEFRTQEKILAELKSLGIEARKAAGTGVIAEIRGARPGKTVAIRADIDALPIQDEIEQPYRSRISGRCHACGHDAHTAMALGVAKSLNTMRENITGNIRLLFQPSEEKFPGGALAMIEDGAMDGVDAVFGAHVWQPFAAGTAGISYGRTMASPDEYTITIQGKGGHGSMPQQTVDPLLVGAQIVLALKTIVGANVDPLEQAVVSLGMFKAGEVFNIIPDTAVLKGTVRTFDHAVRMSIFDRIEQIVRGMCAANGATYTFDKFLGYPPVINDPNIAAIAAAAAGETLGKAAVFEMKPVMGGEDFSYYQQKAPGAFLFIGVGNKEKGLIHPHHHPKFDIDETALVYGCEIMARTALKLLA
ncbi:MAG: amidohydrolase [Negativicutes bacterium]|nr:amidohydrolase [Negativicutes bacterium]